MATYCSIDGLVRFQNNTWKAIDHPECASCISVIIYNYFLTINVVSECLMQVGRSGLSESF